MTRQEQQKVDQFVKRAFAALEEMALIAGTWSCGESSALYEALRDSLRCDSVAIRAATWSSKTGQDAVYYDDTIDSL